jgi:3-oxoacyl-[acyl-carrier-protein] synthase-1
MGDSVVVTGIGIVTAMGTGKEQHWDAFRTGRSALRYPKHLITRHADALLMGEVDLSNDELAALNGLPTGDNGLTRTALLSLAAMQNLFTQTNREYVAASRHAFINANTVGGMSTMENIYMDLISAHTPAHLLKYIQTLDCSHSTELTARHFGLTQNLATISTACSSSANALIMGVRMLRNGMADMAICGGCDALSKYTVNGFNSLKNVSASPCQPFDNNRNGLNLGEAAAYCLLEKEDAARLRGANIIARLSGYANTNDASHPTAPTADGAGAERTMLQALRVAGLHPNDIGYINAHGTATQNNDLAEGLAIQRVFGSGAVFSSTKPFTGHTLAASGVIEAIFTMWALQETTLLPNLNYTTKMEELEIEPVKKWMRNVNLAHGMSNSFGFGGTNVSLVFSKAK